MAIQALTLSSLPNRESKPFHQRFAAEIRNKIWEFCVIDDDDYGHILASGYMTRNVATTTMRALALTCHEIHREVVPL